MIFEGRNRSRREEVLLIQEILEGRQDEFYDMARPHMPALLRFARARMGDDAECEDAVQQTVLIKGVQAPPAVLL